MEVIFLNEDYSKQCCDDRRCDDRRCDDRCCDDRCCDGDQGGSDWETWLPILILLFFLCGGFSGLGFGSNQSGDPCCDNNNGSWGWILILIILFCFLNNGNGNDGKGGFLGGLF